MVCECDHRSLYVVHCPIQRVEKTSMPALQPVHIGVDSLHCSFHKVLHDSNSIQATCRLLQKFNIGFGITATERYDGKLCA